MIQTRDDDCLDHGDHLAHGKKWVDLRIYWKGNPSRIFSDDWNVGCKRK